MSDDLPFGVPLTDANPAAPAPRKCTHPRQYRTFDPVGDVWRCLRCGHDFDPVRIKRGRAARTRGNRYELQVARGHADGVKVGHHGGPADVLIGDMFVMQTKRFAAGRFPGWMSDELAKLPRTGGRIPVLVVGESAGRGVKGRALAIVDYADWLDLHSGPKVEP